MASSPAPSDPSSHTPPGESFDEVVRELGPALWRITAAYARVTPDREDLYQEILAAVWRALPKFEGRSSLRSYVLRIGHNRGLTYRSRGRATRTVEVTEDHDVPDPATPADVRLEQAHERQRLAAAVQRLPSALAQTVTLALEGLSYADIADVLGITENNVGVRMNRARSALTRALRESTDP